MANRFTLVKISLSSIFEYYTFKNERERKRGGGCLIMYNTGSGYSDIQSFLTILVFKLNLHMIDEVSDESYIDYGVSLDTRQ